MVKIIIFLQEDNSNNEAERRFNPSKWGTITNDKDEKLYTEKWKKYFDTRENCSACLFMKNNKKVKNLMNQNYSKKNSININTKIEHVNFP